MIKLLSGTTSKYFKLHDQTYWSFPQTILTQYLLRYDKKQDERGTKPQNYFNFTRFNPNFPRSDTSGIQFLSAGVILWSLCCKQRSYLGRDNMRKTLTVSAQYCLFLSQFGHTWQCSGGFEITVTMTTHVWCQTWEHTHIFKAQCPSVCCILYQVIHCTFYIKKSCSLLD